jgi:hypothetical protein
MGRILCETHGRSPIELVCAHIATPSTTAPMSLPTHCVVTLELYGETTDLRCCEPCATRLRAQASWSEADLELELADAEPVCAVCMADQY